MVMTTLGSETIDPVLNNNEAKPICTPLYDNLIGVGPDGKLSKNTGVARDWKLAPDSMSLTINLRPGIRFHTGDELTSADVKFTLEQFTSSRCISSEVGTLRKIIKSIETPDPLTVVVNYKIPNAVLPNFLSRQMGIEGSVLPKKYFEAHGAQYFNTHPVGSGPYKFVEQKVGSHIKYEAVNSPHWLVGVPKYQYLTFYLVIEESTRIAMLKTGEADIAEVSRDRIREVAELTPFEKKGFSVLGINLQGLRRI
jgi:peptide/nickel transport system substrate-binding protein